MSAPNTAAITHVDDPKFQETWKRVYGKLYSSVPKHCVITDNLKSTKHYRDLGMDGIRFNVLLGTGGNVSNMKDAGRFPTASKPLNKEGRVDVVHTYSAFELGGQAMVKSDQEGAVHVSAVENNVKALYHRVAVDNERQYNGDGRGILCVITAVAGAPTYGCNNPYGVANAGKGTMNLVEEMHVAICAPNGVERGRTIITVVDHDNEDFDTDPALPVVGVQIGDYVTRVNGASYTGGDRQTNLLGEANGILAWVGTGEFEGITHPRWRGQQMMNGGTPRPVTERLVSQLEARIEAASQRSDNLLHYTTPFLRLELSAEISTRTRSTGSTTKAKGGFKFLEINGREVAASPKCARGRWFCLNMSKDVAGMLDLPRGYLGMGERKARLRLREDYDSYRSDFTVPHNAIVHQRNCHGVLGDLQDDDEFLDS